MIEKRISCFIYLRDQVPSHKTAGEKPVFSVQVFLNNFPDPKNLVSDIKKDFI